MRNKELLALGLTLILVSVLVGAVGPVSLELDMAAQQILPAERVAHDPIIIDGNDDFLTQKADNNWNGTGVSGDPITIADYRIEFYDEGITIRNVDLHFAIINCLTEDVDTQYWGSAGIKLVNCSNGLISESDAAMKETGIFIRDSSHITLNSTTVHDCYTGVTITESHHIIVLDNNLGWNDWVGINLTLTYMCTVVGNSIVSVPDYGIWCVCDTSTYLAYNFITSTYLEDEEFAHIGIYSYDSLNFAMHNNTAAACGTGLRMEMTNGSWIWECTFTNTTDYGVYLEADSYNVTLLDNHLGPTEGTNAVDDGVENSWDAPSLETGNYWSDYSGTGYYYIDGTAGSIDHYPNGIVPTVTSTPTTEPSTTDTTITSTTSTTDGVTNSTTTNATPFEIPNEAILMISIGSASVIIIVVIVIIRGKQ